MKICSCHFFVVPLHAFFALTTLVHASKLRFNDRYSGVLALPTANSLRLGLRRGPRVERVEKRLIDCLTFNGNSEILIKFEI